VEEDTSYSGRLQSPGMNPPHKADNSTLGLHVVTQVICKTQETSSIAAFIQGEYDVTEDLSLFVVLRWTREEKNFVAGQAYFTNVARQWERAFNNNYAVIDNV
jgi:hypothetical protein